MDFKVGDAEVDMVEYNEKNVYAEDVRMNVVASAYIREAARILSYTMKDISTALYGISIGLLEKVNSEEIEKVNTIKNDLFISINNIDNTSSSCGV